MERDKLRGSLARLGIRPEDYRVLKLLPLIYVAWSDGKMERVQKERIHLFAARRYELSATAMAVLDGWLSQAPSHEYVTEGLRDMLFLAQAPDDMEVDFSELPALLAHAERIARSTAEALDQPSAVSSEEEAALAEVARELHIDRGESWGALLKGLKKPD
jgi:methionine-rich copper-binding protein CopC